MATLTVRNLDDELKAQLRIRAAENGRSMEAEAREILRAALNLPPRVGLGTWIHERFAGLGLDELEIPPRTELPRIPEWPE